MQKAFSFHCKAHAKHTEYGLTHIGTDNREIQAIRVRVATDFSTFRQIVPL